MSATTSYNKCPDRACCKFDYRRNFSRAAQKCGFILPLARTPEVADPLRRLLSFHFRQTKWKKIAMELIYKPPPHLQRGSMFFLQPGQASANRYANNRAPALSQLSSL